MLSTGPQAPNYQPIRTLSTGLLKEIGYFLICIDIQYYLSSVLAHYYTFRLYRIQFKVDYKHKDVIIEFYYYIIRIIRCVMKQKT